MNFNEFQDACMRTANCSLSSDEQLKNAALGIVGEGGEVSELVKKHFYHNKPMDNDKFCKELGDVLYYVAWAAKLRGLNLEDVAIMNVEKLKARWPAGFGITESHIRNI